MASQLTPPNGQEEIIEVFGNIYDYLDEDGNPTSQWEYEVLQVIKLPFSITYSSNPAQRLTRLRCHNKLAPIFAEVFAAIQERQLMEQVRDCDGSYCFRRKSSGGGLSVHSWGIAIDLNVPTNQPQTPGDMAPELIALFGEYGFEWGGDWSSYRDPMHFQYCTGY